MTEQDILALARTITRDVFTNGQGDEADRLVLTIDGPPSRNLGGWGKVPFSDRLAAILRKELGEGERPEEWHVRNGEGECQK